VVIAQKVLHWPGIKIIGDVPIYVVYDSADVWMNPNLFNLDQQKKPVTVAGVPPDYFSKTGQLWGNPVYRWQTLQSTGYAWWIERIRHNLNLFDVVRVDHFRGFMAYWKCLQRDHRRQRPMGGRTGMDFFTRLSAAIPDLSIIAEDLGTITPDVWSTMEHFGFPGMKVLLFAFDESLPEMPMLPQPHEKCSGLHGHPRQQHGQAWFEKEADQAARERLSRYLGREVQVDNVHRELIRLP